MTKVMRAFAPFALVFGMTLVFTPACGGKKDAKAAKECSDEAKKPEAQKTGDACKKCCNAAGSNGHSWMTGKGCKCL